MLSDNELSNINGGASWGIWSILGGVVTFILGFYEGIINPVKCGK